MRSPKATIIAMADELGFAAIIRDIDAATDEPQLLDGMRRAKDAAVAELNAHTPALRLAADWSRVMARALATAARLVSTEPMAWTWFVSGSVARGEAIPGSDIETLIALDNDVDKDGKASALARAADVHALLERCGFAGDANGVLASRGRFCRRHASWAEGIERWCAEPAEDRGVVMTGLLADAASLSGVDELRLLTLDAAGRYPQALGAMLQDATAFRATIPSRLRVFATHADSVDLKQAAIEPVVKIARWAALSANSAAVATLERLNAAARAQTLDADDAAMLRKCYVSASRIRWRGRAAAWIDGDRITDVISLAGLSPQERATLRDIGRELNAIRRKLTFLASTSSFR